MTDSIARSAAPAAHGLKLNIGCGFNKLDGYLNVDGFSDCAPDMLWDLESTPWPFDEDAVDEIYANHVLEPIGQATGTYFALVRELSRVVRHGGEAQIQAPHPLRNSYPTAPTPSRRLPPD